MCAMRLKMLKIVGLDNSFCHEVTENSTKRSESKPYGYWEKEHFMWRKQQVQRHRGISCMQCTSGEHKV